MVSLREHSVRIPAGSAEIEGVLVLPAAPIGLVLFAHGSGSSRFSPRNVHVARALHARGIGTLLLDLLTLEEDSDYLARFDIALLARRLDAATRWASGQPLTHGLPVGYFGASTGAAAALEAAARQGGGPARRGVVRWPARSGLRRGPGARGLPYLAAGGQSRYRGAGAEPASRLASALHAPPERGPGGDPSLRGTRHPGRGGPAGRRLVCHALAFAAGLWGAERR